MNELMRLKTAVQTRDFPEAKKIAKRLLAQNPRDHEVMILLGNAMMKEGNTDEALRLFLAARRVTPNNPDIENNLGLLYKEQKDLNRARIHLVKARHLAPDRGDIAYNMGNLFQEMNLPIEAKREYREAGKLNPGNPLVDNNLAALAEDEGDTEGAMGFYRAGLKKDPNNPAILFNIGELLASSGDPAEAVHYFRHARKGKPRWKDAILSETRCHRELNQQGEEIAGWEDLIAIEPDSVEFSYNLAIAKMEANQNDSAGAILEELLVRNPRDREPLLARVILAEKTANPGDRDWFLEQLESAWPDDPETLYHRALALNDRGEPEKALEIFMPVRNQIHPSERANALLAELYEETGHYKEALSLRESLIETPDAEEWIRRSRLFNRQGNPERALEALEEALKIIPDDRMLLSDKALLLGRLGRHEEALGLMTSLKEQHPDDPEIVKKLVSLYTDTSQSDAAAAELSHSSGEDLDTLKNSLDLYDQVLDQWEQETEVGWRNNLQALGNLSEERKNERMRESLWMNEEGEEVPILDIGGIEPVIAVMEDEETIRLSEMEEDLHLSPEEAEEPEPELHLTDESSGALTSELPSIPETFRRPEPPAEGGGDSGTENQERNPYLPNGKESPGFSPGSITVLAGNSPITPEEPIIINTTSGTPVPPQIQPPSIAIPTPQPYIESAAHSPQQTVSLQPGDRSMSSERDTGPKKPPKPGDLFAYLEHLTVHLPEEQKEIYENDLKLKFDLMRLKVEENGGLDRVMSGKTHGRLKPAQIEETLKYMGSLTEHSKESKLGVVMKKKIEDIVSKLDETSGGPQRSSKP